jgi:hypothetical protein
VAKTARDIRFRAEMGNFSMADHNMKSAQETYHGFLSWTKWGTIIAAALTVLVIILLA